MADRSDAESAASKKHGKAGFFHVRAKNSEKSWAFFYMQSQVVGYGSQFRLPPPLGLRFIRDRRIRRYCMRHLLPIASKAADNGNASGRLVTGQSNFDTDIQG
jgi:hypothetical protein